MKVGDRVVCVKSATSRYGSGLIKKGKIYLLRDEWSCICGDRHFDVGLITPHRNHCPYCNKSSENTSTLWIISTYFAPIQYNSAHDELINIVEEKLDVEIKEPEKEKA